MSNLRRKKSHDTKSCRRLAGTGLSYETKNLSFTKVDINFIYRFYNFFIGLIMNDQIFNF